MNNNNENEWWKDMKNASNDQTFDPGPENFAFSFSGKSRQKSGTGWDSGPGGLQTHGDSGPGTRDRRGLVLNNTLTLWSVIEKKTPNSFSDQVL